MLPIAVIVLVLGTVYAVSIAPPAQRITVALVFVVLSAAGYLVGLEITQPNTDQRTYYPIAAAIGGLMIAFGWVSNKRKSWPQKGSKVDPKA
jgi:peptidoglycan/LPS O-acetylase OafA/YrhL